MFNIPSRKDRAQAKMFGDSSPLQSIEMSNRSQEVNDLGSFDYNPSMKILNPYSEGDSILLKMNKNSRYGKVNGLSANLSGSISKVLSEDLVNISYWETDPPVIKTVPVNHLVLHSTNGIIAKLRHKALSIVRKLRILFKLTQDF